MGNFRTARDLDHTSIISSVRTLHAEAKSLSNEVVEKFDSK